ncbi:MAG TPA: xanthine dehydrogenase family protein subunit M [Terriglobales bacterium]|nr:xanthine dehydrogenase family protein subunit M [Terriglobales bacterium]
MRPFEYASPRDLSQASLLLNKTWGDSEILAGGTDLLALMKDDVVRPKRLVNIKEIKELRGINAGPSEIRIGALTTLAEIADNAAIMQNYSALAESVNEAASPQIRNLATLGGNLCQRPRCWYFRGGFGLIPKYEDGADMVEDGDNRYHAVLGNDGPAKFVSPSTIAPALIAYGAQVRISGPGSPRQIPLEKFFVIPKNESEREHDLRPNEIVTEVILPKPASTMRFGYYEVRQKKAFDWPLALAAVALDMDGNTVKSARIVMGAVAPVPWVPADAANFLAGKEIKEDTVWVAAQKSIEGSKALKHNSHKIWLAEVAVKRALLKAAGGTA